MKILVITDLYPIKDSEINTPRTIADFAKGWKLAGHEVKIIKPNFLFNAILRKKPIYKSNIYGDIENINYIFPFWGNIKNKIKRDFTPDIIIAHMPSGILFANKLGLPFVAGVHISDLEVLTNPLYSFYFKNALEAGYKNATKIACRSYAIKNKFLKLYPQYEYKTFVCYSGIDKNLIIKRDWKNRKKVLTCANLIKRKHIEKVIFACDNLNVELKIIGDGKEFQHLKKISNKPIFTGHLTREKVFEAMREADIFALPSINETFGMVYLEAMASGCITVCTQDDGISGIIKDGFNGYFWNDNIIETIINSSNQAYILQNSYNTILNFTQEKACEHYLTCILA